MKFAHNLRIKLQIVDDSIVTAQVAEREWPADIIIRKQ
ncbi:hypothetical protein M116_4260 [Bacteroides fragilis str. 3719 A10]|uniref:Uncharacterized protein n=1 Tax=Bacteroides fragilis str. 3998T(B)3 TaxID=1339316 RepID=A0A015TVP6_BACFG|nr:hypothetical protein M079_4336 [Bacteroides fragilis str. 3996 N(B) 6]EXY88479.1 hypothetical protein M125_4835 [Bacteroides fragilis str. 3998T(B)3]EXY93566.1 hypothetical protein M081_4322 [Bacteroides fragilis str. 3998 T(B) 4]EXZ56261.1 hypothetical protein M116_4260 [Bacteroides fragilis str. 3719 A10]EXZ76721.1 hypothetical protein M144_4138 [Bacteroides fragilis str. 3-F-2 \